METEKMQIRRALAEKIARQIEDVISEKSKLDVDALKVDADQFTEDNDDDYTSQKYQYNLEIEGLPVNLIFESYQEEDCNPALSWSYNIDGYDGCIVREHIELDDLIQDVQDILILKDGGNFRELSLERLVYEQLKDDNGFKGDIREQFSNVLSVGELDNGDSDFVRYDNDRIIPYVELTEDSLIEALDGLEVTGQIIIEDNGGYFYRVRYVVNEHNEIHRIIELRNPDKNIVVIDSDLYEAIKLYDPSEGDVEDESDYILEIIQDWHDEYEYQMNDSSYHLKQKEISEKVKEAVTASCNIINHLIPDKSLFIIDKLDRIKKELCRLFYSVVEINGGEIDFCDLTVTKSNSDSILVLDNSDQTCIPSKIFNKGDKCFIYDPDFHWNGRQTDADIEDIPVMHLFRLCDYFHNESKIFNLYSIWGWNDLETYFSIALRKELVKIFHQHPEFCNNPDMYFNDEDGYRCLFLATTPFDGYNVNDLVWGFDVLDIILNDDETFDIKCKCTENDDSEFMGGELNALYQIYFNILDLISKNEASDVVK